MLEDSACVEGPQVVDIQFLCATLEEIHCDFCGAQNESPVLALELQKRISNIIIHGTIGVRIVSATLN